MDELFNAIAEHLRSTGYDVIVEDGIIKASDPERIEFWVLPIGEGAFFRTLVSKGPETRSNEVEYLKFLVKANRNSIVARFTDFETSLAIEAWFPNHFDADSFGHFFKLYIGDIIRPAESTRTEVDRWFPA